MASPTDPTAETRPKEAAAAAVAPPLSAPRLARCRLRLVSIHGVHLGKRWTVDACGLVIGRDPAQAGLVLPDPAVSGRHCALEHEPVTGAFTVSDLGSRNGTFVNSEKIAERHLSDGDRIFIGETVLEFSLDDTLGAGFHSGIDGRVDVDALTGLLVKRAFDLELARAFARAVEGAGSLSLLMMSLDELALAGDDKPRKVGSLCIAEVGRIIRELVGVAGCACRNGSDEFLAFLHPVESVRGMELAASICTRVAAYEFERDGVRLHPTISIGMAELHAGLPTPDHLLQAADEALYRARSAGRNQVSR